MLKRTMRKVTRWILGLTFVLLCAGMAVLVTSCDSGDGDDGGQDHPVENESSAAPPPDTSDRLVVVAAVFKPYADAQPHIEIVGQGVTGLVRRAYYFNDATRMIVERESCSNESGAKWDGSVIRYESGASSVRGITDGFDLILNGDYVDVEGDTDYLHPETRAYWARYVFLHNPNCLNQRGAAQTNNVTVTTRDQPR